PGAESPIDIALGLVDAIELICYDDPTQLPSHWGPWENSGMSQAEFTVMRSLDLYYQYLNSGFRVPITAGTDKMGENIPVGSNRLAARVAEDPASKGRILPRGLTVFAHTNPIYFLRSGTKVRELSSIRYLQKYLKGTTHWLNTGARFATTAEKEEALRQAEQA